MLNKSWLFCDIDIFCVPALLLRTTKHNEDDAAHGVNRTRDPEDGLPVFNVILTVDHVAYYHGGNEPHSVT